MRHEMYIFKENRLVGLQNVTGWLDKDIEASTAAHKAFGHTVDVSDKGRAICCVCKLDLGESEIPAGVLTHGYCDEHFKQVIDEIERSR